MSESKPCPDRVVLEKALRGELPPADVESIASQRVTALLETRLRNLDRLVVERMQRMVPLARGLGEDDDEVAVMAMLLDDFYQKSLHAPPELPSGDEPPPKSPEQGEGGGSRRGSRRGRRRKR